MVVIAGCLVISDDKVLMVKESKKECYGMWNFPAGHVEENETYMDAAKREVKEETGYGVKIIGQLPEEYAEHKGEPFLSIKYVSEPLNYDNSYDHEEILEVRWFSFEEVLGMTKEELRGYDLNRKTLQDYLSGNFRFIEEDKIKNR